MPALRHGVQQQARWTVVVGDQNIDATVVIHVAKSGRSTDLGKREGRAGRSRHILETFPLAQIAEQQVTLAVRKRLAYLRCHPRYASVGGEQVLQTAIFHIQQADAKAGVWHGSM